MIKIIKADITHSLLLSEIAARTFIESHGRSASTEDINFYVKKNYNEISFKKELQNPDNIYHLLYYNNLLAAYSKINLNFRCPGFTAQNTTKFDRLYVLKEFYGLGIGAKLFEFNFKLIKKNNQKGIWLYVWVENERALHFYKKNGFTIIGSHNFKISESHSNPNHHMFLNLY